MSEDDIVLWAYYDHYVMPTGTHEWQVVEGKDWKGSFARCKLCGMVLTEEFAGHGFAANDSQVQELYGWMYKHEFIYPLTCEEYRMEDALE